MSCVLCVRALCAVHDVCAVLVAQEIKITGCQVFVDPFKEMVVAEAKADAEAAKKVLFLTS